jgi:hypothetical protein
MNFVFILQFFRINSQFEIALAKIHCLHCLISEFLEAVPLPARRATCTAIPSC